LRRRVPFRRPPDPADNRAVQQPGFAGLRARPSGWSGGGAPGNTDPGRPALRPAGAAVPLVLGGDLASDFAGRPPRGPYPDGTGTADPGVHGRRLALSNAAVSEPA